MLITVVFNPSSMARICVRATNWLGDAVMSLPALRAIRQVFPQGRITLIVRPGLTGLYERESCVDAVLPYPAPKSLRDRRRFAGRLREERFDCAILLQNAFDAALITWLAGIPERIGYRRDGRGWLLTRPIQVPAPGEIPRHERFYYLELLRRAGMMERFPDSYSIRLEGLEQTRQAGLDHLRALALPVPVVGVSPGAAYGTAKRWLPERFAEAAVQSARSLQCAVVAFGSPGERELCDAVVTEIRGAGVEAHNMAGETTLREFIDLSAACRLFLTNDSGAMHVASALGVPTVAVFGATDDTTTGPTGPLARVIREHAECSPCLLRECPIDHRCMTRVTARRVIEAGLEMLQQTNAEWTPEPKS